MPAAGDGTAQIQQLAIVGKLRKAEFQTARKCLGYRGRFRFTIFSQAVEVRILPYHKPEVSMIAAIFACIFGILGIIYLGVIFVPLAALCTAIGIVRSLIIKNYNALFVAILGGILTIIGFIVSPSMWLLTTGLLVSSNSHVSSENRQRSMDTPEQYSRPLPQVIPGIHKKDISYPKKFEPSGPFNKTTLSVLEQGSIEFVWDGTNTKLPLYITPISYALNDGTPIRLPNFGPIKFRIPTDQAYLLAAYFSPAFGLFIGPRGMSLTANSVMGVDGSGVLILTNEDTEQGRVKPSWIYYTTTGACAGCAADQRFQWFPDEKMPFIPGTNDTKGDFTYTTKIVMLNDNTEAFSYNVEGGGTVNGVSISPVDRNSFQQVFFYAPALGHNVSTTVLNFFIHEHRK